MTIKVEDGDAKLLVEYFTNKANGELNFFWKYQLDDDKRLMNLFFRDSRCDVDYDSFGDVMSVDTTYRTNRYNFICAPFVGINHHTSNVLFGMMFMSDEAINSFMWLFETFLESMYGKEPKVIFTYQCQAMMNAIDNTFTNAKHRLCKWHINQNAPSHFSNLNGNSKFKRLWYKCMNDVDSETEFEETWSEMMENYNLIENRWFSEMYKLRRRWASVFTRGIFTAEIQMRWRRKERAEDTLCLWLPGQFVDKNDLLTHATIVYTQRIFKLFEFEMTHSFNVKLDEIPLYLSDDNLKYKTLSNAVDRRLRTIVFNRNTQHTWCSCGMWASEGIFCRHIIKVYYIKNVDTIPKEFILRRWTKHAKDGTCMPKIEEDHGSTLKYMLFVNEIMRHVYDRATSAKDFDSARKMIVEQLNALRSDVACIVGSCGGMDEKKNEEMKDGIKFHDPKTVRDSVNARKRSHWEGGKGKKASKKPDHVEKAGESEEIDFYWPL